MGTGGTITGIGRYLKEKNPGINIIGADPAGSILYEFFHKGTVGKAETYKVEGIGEDFFPTTLDFSVIDNVVLVSDKDSFLWTRRLARLEGIFAGGSAGTALAAAMNVLPSLGENDLMVVFIPDTGLRYLSKIYSDPWMKDNQYIEASLPLTASEIVAAKAASGPTARLVTVSPSDPVSAALDGMQSNDFSQLPVFESGAPVGAVYEDEILTVALAGKDLKKLVVREIMSPAFPVVSSAATIDQISIFITRDCPAVFVELGDHHYEILTKFDLFRAVAQRLAEKQ